MKLKVGGEVLCCVGVRKADHRERDERYVFSMRSFQTGLDPKLSHQTGGWPISDGKRNFKGSKREPNFGTLGEKCRPQSAQLGPQRCNTSLSSPKPMYYLRYGS
jgi:hypothetical protein